jgi:hypothetical protein
MIGRASIPTSGEMVLDSLTIPMRRRGGG